VLILQVMRDWVPSQCLNLDDKALNMCETRRSFNVILKISLNINNKDSAKDFITEKFMKNNTYIHDFECFPFYQNVIQSKLGEAQEHLKRVEMYKLYPELFTPYKLDEIISIYEEQSDFMAIVQKQCCVWREHGLNVGQLSKISVLEGMTKKLEAMTYHILYIVENIQRTRHASPCDELHEREGECIKEH
jgi:hypothetical protein